MNLHRENLISLEALRIQNKPPIVVPFQPPALAILEAVLDLLQRLVFGFRQDVLAEDQSHDRGGEESTQSTAEVQEADHVGVDLDEDEDEALGDADHDAAHDGAYF